jgi:hypothetical protein
VSLLCWRLVCLLLDIKQRCKLIVWLEYSAKKTAAISSSYSSASEISDYQTFHISVFFTFLLLYASEKIRCLYNSYSLIDYFYMKGGASDVSEQNEQNPIGSFQFMITVMFESQPLTPMYTCMSTDIRLKSVLGCVAPSG